jgi:hypothetical protein
LVATGLTNQQVAEPMFLSRHTVDFHLRQIFRRLGIASRVETDPADLSARPSNGVAATPHGWDSAGGAPASSKMISSR